MQRWESSVLRVALRLPLPLPLHPALRHERALQLATGVHGAALALHVAVLSLHRPVLCLHRATLVCRAHAAHSVLHGHTLGLTHVNVGHLECEKKALV